MARRSQDRPSDFNPFIDILTCLAGIMILIVISVVLQTQDAKILIPTPMLNAEVDLEPIFIESSVDGRLYYIALEELIDLADKQLQELNERRPPGVDSLEWITNQAGRDPTHNEYFQVEMGHALSGNFNLRPREGRPVRSSDEEMAWFKELLNTLDTKKQMLAFIVRSSDKSYRAFRRARSVAWVHDVHVAYEVLDKDQAMGFGANGITLRPN